MFKRYACPDATGWLGWFETWDGDVIAWVGVDRRVTFATDLKGTVDCDIGDDDNE